MADRGYANLLTHLHRPSTSLQLKTISASLAHYLAHTIPSPTPLSAATISSPLFTSTLSHAKFDALTVAFRGAVHLRWKGLKDETGYGVFTRGRNVRLREWAGEVLKGFEGGIPLMRLACAGGLLIGIEDLKVSGKADLIGKGRGKVENEVLISLAEIMETFEPRRDGGWEKEFWPAIEEGQVDALSLSLIIASQSLPSIPDSKLRALPLPALARHLTAALTTAFHSGSFLDSLTSSTSQKDGCVFIAPTSLLPTTLHTLSSSPLFTSVASLSKLTSRVIGALVESKPAEGLRVAVEVIGHLDVLARGVEIGWRRGALKDIRDEESIAPESRETTTQIWTVLKTLLFATIMIAESTLSATVFTSPSSFYNPPSYQTTTPLTAQALSLHILSTLSHLSFIISQFGGVTTTSGDEFPQLKKTFYLGVDVISTDSEVCQNFVEGLCAEEAADGSAMQQAKKAFALACIEQLVPVLGEDMLPIVFRTCFPYLSDPTHRETFESAHSVVLGMFATHAQKLGEGKVKAQDKGGVNFVESLVPFYAGCLIENSVNNRLSTPQLRLAYSALVRSASSGISSNAQIPGDSRALTLTQYCIDALLASIQSSSEDKERAHRLHLTLVSTLPSLPLRLLQSTLSSIRDILQILPIGSDERKTLVEDLFSEILERIGDQEKEFVMRWWYDERDGLVGSENIDVAEVDDHSTGVGTTSRL